MKLKNEDMKIWVQIMLRIPQHMKAGLTIEQVMGEINDDKTLYMTSAGQIS